MTRRVLITGATGLIGRVLVPRLARTGADVRTISRSGGDIRADLADAAAASDAVRETRPETIVHLAGGQRGSASELVRDNVETTLNVLRAAGAIEPVPAVVVAGSAAEYGEPRVERIREDCPLDPMSDYGRVKAAQTLLARVFAAELALPLTIVRPFNVVGAGLPRVTALGNVATQLVNGERRVRCGRLDVVRDFVPVSCVAEAFALLALEPRPGTFNVCSGRGIALGDVLNAIAEELAVDVEVEPVPELVALRAADRVVGDPSKLAAIGVSCEATATSIARALLGR